MTRRTSIIDSIDLWAMRPAELVALADSACEDLEAAAASIGLAAPKAQEERPPYENVGGVAVIPVEGLVMRRDEGRFWSTAGLKDIDSALSQALADPSARAVMLQVYSPGGAGTGVKELADRISAARAEKPMAAWIDGLGASAAYWLASATGRVYAGPSAVVGSIGVLYRHVSVQGLNKAMGLQVSYVTAGQYKALGNQDQELSEAARAKFQARADAVYDMFTADVARSMGLAFEARDAWANGKDFLAAEAEGLGLVSAIVGSRDEAISKLLSETRMDTTELKTTYPEQVATLQTEAVEAALQGQAEALAAARAEAVEGVLALAGAVCDEATAQRLRAVVDSGMTPAQLKTAKALFAAPAAAAPARPAERPDARAEILAGIMAATPQAVAGDAPAPAAAEDDLIKRIGGRQL